MPELYAFQQEAMNAIDEAEKLGINRQLLCLPTGAGKTVLICAQIAKREGVSMMVAHMKNLISQAKRTALEWIPHKKVGILGRDDVSDCDFIIATIQTASRRTDMVKALNIQTLVIDEAHHATAKSYKEFVDSLGFMNNKHKFLLGVTATPKQDSGDIFQEIVYSRTIFDLIRDGWLCPLIGKRIYTKTSLKELTGEAGGEITAGDVEQLAQERENDFNEKQLSHVVNTFERNSLIVNTYLKFASDRKRTICFCASRLHAKNMADLFNQNGVECVFIDGTMEESYIDEQYDKLRDGSIKMLANCNLMTEGNDIKPVDCILMARPTRSDALYTQMVGRGARKHIEKDNCLILDFNDKDCQIITLSKFANRGDQDEVAIVSSGGSIDDEDIDLEYRYQDSDMLHSDGTILDEDIDFETPGEKLSSDMPDVIYNKLPYGKNRYSIIPATDKQIQCLRSLVKQGHAPADLEIDLLSKSKASQLIGKYLNEKKPTPKMIYVLKKFKCYSDELSFSEARALIAALKNSNKRSIDED